MKFYTVYSRHGLKIEDAVLVKEGFNWYDFFFGMLWSGYKKIWSLAAIHGVVFVTAILILKLSILNSFIIGLIKFFINIAVAFHANDFYRKALIRNGYAFTDVVLSDSEEQALLKFLERNYKNS